VPHAIHSRTIMDRSADAAVASSALKIAKFFGYPFRIVLAMRPQRERQAAWIAEELSAASSVIVVIGNRPVKLIGKTEALTAT
jgi:hypothetical protein